VRAGQLTLLVSKPRSLRSVTNPLAATGGSEGEALEDARRNVPQKMLTLGRVISLRDAEDFARSFAGVTKARAAWSWTGGAQEIYLTVAGEDEAPLPLDTGVLPNLAASLRAVSAPGTAITLRPARIARFTLRAKLRVAPDHLAADGTAGAVMTVAQSTLRNAFAFANRDIGQPVRASDIILLLQGVAGVVAVDMDQLYRTDGPAAANALLRADVPRSGVQGSLTGAEILLLSADPIVLEVF
jgi:predicted phage baseplate assembly protein